MPHDLQARRAAAALRRELTDIVAGWLKTHPTRSVVAALSEVLSAAALTAIRGDPTLHPVIRSLTAAPANFLAASTSPSPLAARPIDPAQGEPE